MPGRLIIIQVPDSVLTQRLENPAALRTVLATLGEGDQVEMVRREKGKVIAAPYTMTMDIARTFGDIAVDLVAVSSVPGIPVPPSTPTSYLLPFRPSAQTTLAVLPSSYYNTIKTQLGGHQLVEWTTGKVNIDLSKLRKQKKNEGLSRYIGDDYAARLEVSILNALPNLRFDHSTDPSCGEAILKSLSEQLSSIRPTTASLNIPSFTLTTSTPALDKCLEEVRKMRVLAETVVGEWKR